MTSSNARPPSARVCGPNATSASRMSSSKSGSRNSTWYLPIGPSWLKIDLAVPEPAHHLREVLHLRGGHRGTPKASYIAAIPRPMPSVNRPPESRCIVVAHEAVISGWRVL